MKENGSGTLQESPFPFPFSIPPDEEAMQPGEKSVYCMYSVSRRKEKGLSYKQACWRRSHAVVVVSGIEIRQDEMC